MQFFSDRERGEQMPTRGDFSVEIWEAIWAHIDARIDDGSFGQAFPEICPDGSAIIGTDSRKFFSVAQGMIPGFDPRSVRSWVEEGGVVPTLEILDFIEFCHAHVARPLQGPYHGFFKHHHLSFDRAAGQTAFRDAVNTILARNRLTYRLQDTGEVQRTAPVELVGDLRRATFATGDTELDKLLEHARTSYLSPHEDRRRSGLEKLWDAFERLKTLEDADKKQGTKLILDRPLRAPLSCVRGLKTMRAL